MTAQLVMSTHDIALHPDQWAKQRQLSIGASEIATLLGLAPRSHGNPFTLYVEKTTGEQTGERDNTDMERGRVLEDYVAERFAALRPDLLVLPGGMYRDEHCEWMTATVDRLAVSRDRLGDKANLPPTAAATLTTQPEYLEMMTPAELKTAISKNDDAGRQIWGEPYTAQIPTHYRCQAYWQMAVWGGDLIYVPAHFMGSWKTELYVVERTDEVSADIEFMVKQAAKFLDRIANGDPPDLDWSPETTSALLTLNPLEEGTTYRATKRDAERLRAAYRRKNLAEQRYKLLANQLTAKAGGAQKIVVADPERPGKDVNVMGRAQYPHPSIDSDALRAQHPHIAAEVTRYTDVDRWAPGQRWMKLGQ